LSVERSEAQVEAGTTAKSARDNSTGPARSEHISCALDSRSIVGDRNPHANGAVGMAHAKSLSSEQFRGYARGIARVSCKPYPVTA
jgi:hypothetical protein